MNKKRIQAIGERLAAATPRPWVHDGGDVVDSSVGRVARMYHWPKSYGLQSEADAEFISNAPTDIADLIAEVERLMALLEGLDYRPDC